MILKTTSQKELCEVTAREIQRFIGFDRVMIYRFDSDWNGEVIAEARSRSSVTSFLGHYFPATDIPSQARAVLLSNWVRMIPDVGYVPSPIVPTLNPKTHLPLDLSLAYLRSVSPLHIQYLKNMNVGSSITISLIEDGKLWGPIACHNKEPKLLDTDLRSICSFIGKQVSSQLRVKIENETKIRQNRAVEIHGHLVESMLQEDDLVKGLLNYSPTFLELTQAHGAALAIHSEGEWSLIGSTPTQVQIKHLSAWLSQYLDLAHSEVFHTNCLPFHFPEATAYRDRAAGLLAVRIPKGKKNFLLWFRPDITETISWAGRPNKNIEKMPDGTLKIEPRLSFETWKENVTNYSRPWSSIEINAAMELQHSIMAIDLRHQFKRVKKSRSLLEQEIKDKKNMFATVSHDLKNPLSSFKCVNVNIKKLSDLFPMPKR
jgi:chemotaxis family two-component system sensor kinase Cph1